MKATRQDVARLAGVSTATVSYVLNKSKPISEETAGRVLRAVKELDYRPDFIARSMSTRESMQLAIFLDNISNPFYGEIIRGFEAAASAKGYFVNVCTSHQRYDDYFENAISRRLDGLFIMSPPTQYDPARLTEMARHGISVIVSGYFGADVRVVSSIENDYLAAMRDAMNLLYARGHRDIAYLSGLNRTMPFDLRARGYLDMVSSLKLSSGDSLLVDGLPSFGTSTSDGYTLAKRLLALKKPFTAVVCVNDLTALGAYNAFREVGLRIPEDVAVVGFDDIPFCEFVTPTLTTLALDKPAFGKKAFDLLHTHMTQGSTGFYLNRLALVERQSTAGARNSVSNGDEAKK